MTLKSFPRGGKKPSDKPPAESQLFKEGKKKRNDRNERRKQKGATEEDSNLLATSAERLSYSILSEGLVVLGRVHEATEYDLIVDLPGSIRGRVQVTDVSEAYTSYLQRIIKSEDQPDEFKPLPELYQPGDYVTCYVKSIQPNERWHVVLSLEPRLVNQNLDINCLSKGSKVTGTVKSAEDHGFVVDVGLTNVRAFIPSKDGETSYFPGKQVLCHVKEIKTSDSASTMTLSTVRKHVKAACATEIKSLDALTPGTRLQLFVKRVMSNGLEVKFGNDNTGYVNQIYLEEPLSSYASGLPIIGSLLYVMPTVKFAYFSLLKEKRKDDVKCGDVIERAAFLFRESNGIVLRLNDSGARGFLPAKKTDIDYEDIVSTFAPGTEHKCRLLTYNWMENTFTCSTQREVLARRYLSLSDFAPGQVVAVKIKDVNLETNFVRVQIDKFNGVVAPEHVSDEGLSDLRKLKVDQDATGRVLSVDSRKNRIYFTLKESLVHSDLPALCDIHQAKKGAKHHGTVVQVNKNGLLVRFFGEVKGWVSNKTLDAKASDVNWNYSIGQTVMVQIDSVDVNLGKMMLSITSKEIKEEESVFTIGEAVEGTVTDSSAQGIYLRVNKDNEQTTGFLPAGHMSPCPETAALLASKAMPGDSLKALVFSTTPSLILTRMFLPQERYRKFDQLKRGDLIPCSVRDIEANGVRVILPIADCTPFGFVTYGHVSSFNLLRVNQLLFAQIIAINKKEKQLALSLMLKKIYDGLKDSEAKMMAAVDVLSLYFDKISELRKNPFYGKREISKVSLGEQVAGQVEKVTDDGLVIKLENDLRGIVRKEHYSGNIKVGKRVRGTILWINYANEYVDLTLLPKLMQSISPKQSKQQSIPTATVLRGTIAMVTNWFILIVLKGQGNGSLAALPARRHLNDVQPDLSPYAVHSKVRVYVLFNRNKSDIMPICMVKSAFEVRKPGTGVKPVAEKSTLKRKEGETNSVSAKRVKSEVVESEEEVAEVKSEEESEDEEPSTVERTKRELEKPRVPECGFYWDDKPDPNIKVEEASSESEDEVKEPKQKKKKLSSAERREEERQKEREIRQREEALVSNQLPNSVDQFDRLVLASPDSSLIWLQYMAYHLQATEIEKARSVARRAIKTISFREEGEKLNVWNAWLNLESKFGTPESLNEVFQEALRANDALKVYTHMLTVFVDCGRKAELEKLVNTMIGKFKQSPQVWIECGTAFLKLGLKDKSRHVMQRALQSLPASQHVNLMVRFAILENKFEDKERSQTLFEQILTSYPKRVDVWSSYVDTLVKSEDIDIARKVLERAAVQSLPARKMKTLFKKCIAFEEQFGTKEDVERVQRMALEYVEKQCNKESV